MSKKCIEQEYEILMIFEKHVYFKNKLKRPNASINKKRFYTDVELKIIFNFDYFVSILIQFFRGVYHQIAYHQFNFQHLVPIVTVLLKMYLHWFEKLRSYAIEFVTKQSFPVNSFVPILPRIQ